MGDDPGCVNAVSENMPGFIGSHREPVGKFADSGQVQTRSSDFGLETTMGDALDFQYDENESKESEHGYRKLSPVDVLARNFGPPNAKPTRVVCVETSGDLQRVENLDHGKSQHQQSSSIGVPQGTCRPSAVVDSRVETTKDLEVVESILESFLSSSEGHRGTSVPSSLVENSVETSTDPESIMENVDCRRAQCSSSSSFSKGTSRPSSAVRKPKDLQRMARLDHARTRCSSSVSVSEGTSRPSSVFVDSSVEPMLESHKKAPSFLSASEGHLGTSIPSSFVETSKDLHRWDHRKTPYIFSFGFSKGAFRPSSVVDRRVETSKDLQRLDSSDLIRTQYSSCISVSDRNSVSRPSVVDRDLDRVRSRLETLDHKTVPSILSTSEEHLRTSRPPSLADQRVQISKDLQRLDRMRTQYSSCVSVSKGTCSEETTKDLDKVESILEDLERRRSAEKRRNQSSVGREMNAELPDFLSSVKSGDLESFASDGGLDSASRHVDEVGSVLQTMDLKRSAGLHRGHGSTDEFPDVESEDPEPSDSELREETNCNAESCQSKEHIYCTVYCIANDNYRRPSESMLMLGHGSPSLADGPEGSDEEMEHYPEAYTLSDLVDPMMFNSILNVDELALTCRVCLDIRPIRPLHCCKKAVCEECLKAYIGSQVQSGRADIACPIPECSGYLEESVVVAHLASEDVAKYKYFLELSRLDSGTKACPRCSLFTSLKGRSHPAPAKIEQKYKIECSKCQLVWCFKCHAPWHEGLKCRDYKKGDKLLRHWASVIEHGQRNAQKCPRCRIHIQRTEGCDHMTCTQCNTNFCYRCGGRYRQLRFFGDHTSNLSVFGCKYRYLPDKPHLRRLIRGSVCVSKVLVAPVLMVLVVVVGALALVVGLFAFPIYCICKKRKKHSNGTGRWLC